MIEWAAIALRFAVHADLMVLAGLALGGGLGGGERPRSAVLRWIAFAGCLLAVAQFIVTAIAMTGGTEGLDREMLSFLLTETPMGISTAVRIVALAAVAVMGLSPLTPVMSVTALATLAWSGHAGAAEGDLAWLHRGSDIVHLVAGAVWIGGLIVLGRLVRFSSDPDWGRHAIEGLRRFSTIGAIVVALLTATGAINLVAIVGMEDLPAVASTAYGQVLGLKLALFAGMLALAALNRLRLTPRLEADLASGVSSASHAALRRSLRLELALGFAVLALVAVLGTLSPTG